MHETDGGRSSKSSMDRRDLLKRGAVAGAVAWTAPTILSGTAYAAEGGGGTPKCRPDISLTCTRFQCTNNKYFPGIIIGTGPCGCANSPAFTSCIKISNVVSNCGANVAYGNDTSCGPNPPNEDEILSTGGWTCVDPNELVYFGRPRSGNGAIPEMGSNCTITFQLAVWAGGCVGVDGVADAYNCETYNVTINWNNGTNQATCTFLRTTGVDCAAAGSGSPCGAC
jgi:hypothetical protein